MPKDKPVESSNVFGLAKISLHFQPESYPSKSHVLVFFITGNPGLIGYYTTYLQTLYDLLTPAATHNLAHLHIYGQSFAGFQDDETSLNGTPYSLEDQIQRLESSIKSLCTPSTVHNSQPYGKVILIGHSVGSYILLELIRRLRVSSSAPRISAGILLFPTVTHIAQSPSGVKISRLFQWHDSPRRVGQALQRVFSVLPRVAVTWLVRTVTRMPASFATVTAEFLQSRIGIWQALHMAHDEMKYITEDKWDEEIWGVETRGVDQDHPPPKLIFYFGDNDHWVADHARDALIALRGQQNGSDVGSKPTMIIDQDGIPHGFCLKHGEIVAEKTKVWIEQVLWNS